MMANLLAKPHLLHPHWKKVQGDFVQQLSLLKERISSNAVHDIRVAAKKLRALLALYTRLRKEPEQVFQLHITVNFFDVLGRYRDTETCLALLQAWEKNSGQRCPALGNFFRQQLKTTRGWANQEIHRYRAKELARMARLLKEEQSLEDGMLSFRMELAGIIHEQLAHIKKHLRKPHLVRKRLKEIYYWIPLLPAPDLTENWHPKDLHAILDCLGNWQDLEILDRRVKHFRKDFLPQPHKEYETLKALLQHLRDEKKKLSAAAIRQLRSWMKKVPVAADVK